MTPVAIFVRVSSKRQDYQRQINELMAIADQREYQVVRVFKEVGSATKRKKADRPELLQMMELACSGEIRKLLVSEVSRLGRKASETLFLLEQLSELGVSIYAKNCGMESLTEAGEPTPGAAYVFAIQAVQASEEVRFLSNRIKSGLAEAKRRNPNLKVGRPKGSFKPEKQLLEENSQAVLLLRQGKSIRATAELASASIPKVQKIKKALNL